MIHASVQSLTQSLTKRFYQKAGQIAQDRAREHTSKVRKRANNWLIEIRRHLSVPEEFRGRTKGRLNPHNTFEQNKGYPMRGLTGELLASLSVLVYFRKLKDNTYKITTKRVFAPTMREGENYSEILNSGGKKDKMGNGKNPNLKDFKLRAFQLLDQRIRNIR